MKHAPTRIIVFSLLVFFFLTSFCEAATERRIALVIGNSNYEIGRLRNPVNDATDMAAALKKLGFFVLLKNDVGHQAMEKAIKEFGRQLKKDDVGLFFYAGHGVQIDGRNYLIPLGANIEEEGDVKYKAVNLNRVFDVMDSAGNRLNIVILDACRDNPYARSFRSANRGLAIVGKSPRDTLIAYSTSPGQVAMDGGGRNSPYTRALLSNISRPGLSIEQVFKKVRNDLDNSTNGKQVPWYLASLGVDFYFNSERQAAKGDDIADEAKRLAEDKKRLEEERRSLEEERKKIDDLKRKTLQQPTDLAMGKHPEAAKKEKTKTQRDVFTDPATGMEMIFVKGGCFQMGDTFGDGDNHEKPVHEVCVDDFYLGKYEVTQGQWKRIMRNNPSHFSNCGDNCPVEKVSWDDVQDFIRKLNSQSGKNYRLPTEAEWEYAARSGGKSEQYAGGNDVNAVAWYDGNSVGKTHPAGQKQPNGLGLYDMSGNVWEWCNDWYGSNYYSQSTRNNPEGPSSGTYRVLRAGTGTGSNRTPVTAPSVFGCLFPRGNFLSSDFLFSEFFRGGKVKSPFCKGRFRISPANAGGIWLKPKLSPFKKGGLRGIFKLAKSTLTLL